jgi:hypothetical protein
MAVGEWDQRQLCPDGGCVGVIGPDGTCKVCGRAAVNWGDERKRGLLVPDDDGDGTADTAGPDGDDYEDEDDDDGDGDDDDGDDDDEAGDDDGEDGDDAPVAAAVATAVPADWRARRLCPDGACIGLIGLDGRCKVCGRPATDPDATDAAVDGAPDARLAPGAEAKPADADPADAKPASAAPADARPADAKLASAAPADAKLADAKLASAAPTDAKPADAKLASAAPADAKPADAKLASAAPTDAKPAAATPAAAGSPAPEPGTAEPATSRHAAGGPVAASAGAAATPVAVDPESTLVPCPDAACAGVSDRDGKCTVCGKLVA